MEFICDPCLVLYLPLHQLDGSSFMSRDAYGHLCTATGALWTPRGRSFDGSDDILTVADNSAFAIATAVTAIVWAKPNTGYGQTSPRLIERGDGKPIRMLVSATSGIPSVAIYISGTQRNLAGLTSLPVGAFSQLAFTFDGTTRTIYYNGGVDTSNSDYSGTIDTAVSDLTVGNTPGGGRCFNGLIGEVHLYNRALTPLEIQHNYLATKWRYR